MSTYPPPYPPQPPYAAPHPPHDARQIQLPSPPPGIVCIILGSVGLALATFVALIPGALFLLGGGGNVDAFNDFASGFITTSVILFLLSIPVVVLGIVLTVRVTKRRRALRAARPPMHPRA